MSEPNLIKKFPKIPTVEDIENWVIEHEARCVMCGARILKGSVGYYPHPNGVLCYAKGYAGVQRMWIYFHCRKCDYDNSLYKIIHQIKVRMEAKKEVNPYGRRY